MPVEMIEWLDQGLVALTALERWQAARHFDTHIMTSPWFILGCVLALLIMIPLLFWVSLRRMREEQRNRNETEHHLDDTGRSDTLSSRRISIGQKVLLRPRQGSEVSETKADVVQNGPDALTLQLHGPMTITFGPLWRVCYYIGVSVWAFDMSVKSYDGRLLVLKHSDQGRFMNRRRFVRVPVKYPALIARFSFEYIPSRPLSSVKTVTKKAISKGAFGLDQGYVPTFVPALVTEVAGPGLSIEASLDVKTGDRLLVMFDPDHEAASDQTSVAAYRPPKRMIADVAEVRHTRPNENGLSIAVELSEAKGSEVSELIRLTNTALIRRQEEKKKATMETMSVTTTSVAETVAV